MIKKNAKKINQMDEMLKFDPNKAVSSTDCTGLIQRPIKSDEESEAFVELFDVYQPDGIQKPHKNAGEDY